MQHIIHSIAELETAAEALLAFAERQPDSLTARIMVFDGEIGAGKTTFIKTLCQLLGVEDAVTSPTFSLINEYPYCDADGQQQLVYHMDLYRLRNAQEALDIGIEEILDSGAYCFIEWPEIVEHLLPEGHIKISLEIMPDSSRKILFL